jgi:hypothetical protein
MIAVLDKSDFFDQLGEEASAESANKQKRA